MSSETCLHKGAYRLPNQSADTNHHEGLQQADGVLVNERRIHQIFKISVLLKGAHAIIECLSGFALALVSTGTIAELVRRITQDELAEDPHDLIATHLLSFAQEFSISTKNFYAFYLLSHGIVKLLLVVGLLKKQMWSYPASIIAMFIFIAYQIYRFSYTGSYGLIALTILDVIVIALIWHEYRLMRSRLPVS